MFCSLNLLLQGALFGVWKAFPVLAVAVGVRSQRHNRKTAGFGVFEASELVLSPDPR